MDSFKISIEGKQFKRAYLLYIIELIHENDRFYYVGQTGDRKHISARPAFRRLSGHLSDQGKSTENQLYKAVARDVLQLEFDDKAPFDQTTKNLVSDYLQASKIEMHVFPIKDFISGCSKEEHTANRKQVEAIEAIIIDRLINHLGREKCLNINIPRLTKSDEDLEKVVSEIFNTVFPK